ncbi:hypothetical protein NSK_005085 [Nannochloropsis salina CCMP1776]|uniref:F-box domain-containing protein n=1 Tax=Nannochloropsis salina CCMP1776 TaxID=1027361 RepID=A0A4D9CXL7_9STRA|nr:hypothetical protein NSK_005085 [Nannochloropsis salina CCMP1776]|eukprot:TFJ83990.1 hypothetical protein NSK_005085 [Nannochloropsis salina CCMP1776]
MFQVRTIIVETGWQMIWEVGVMNRETRRGGAGNGAGAGSVGGSSGGSISNYTLVSSSSSTGQGPMLHRAVFLAVAGQRVVWDKERPEVWEAFVGACLQTVKEIDPCRNHPGITRTKDKGHRELSPIDTLRRGSSEGSLKLSPEQAKVQDLPPRSHATGNGLLAFLPMGIVRELFVHHLSPSDCARCVGVCRDWAIRAGDEDIWRYFLASTFGITLPRPSTTRTASKTGKEYQHTFPSAADDFALHCHAPPSSLFTTTEVDAGAFTMRRRHANEALFCDLSTLALEADGEELTACAKAEDSFSRATVLVTHPPHLAPKERGEIGENLCENEMAIQTGYGNIVYCAHFFHPRLEYGRWQHVYWNTEALAESAGGTGGNGERKRRERGVSILSGLPQEEVAIGNGDAPGLSPLPRPQQLDRLVSKGRSTSSSRASPSSHPRHLVARFHGHDRGMVLALHVDEQKDRLISGDVSGCVRLWALHSGRKIGTVDLRTNLSCLVADSRTLYVGTLKGVLYTIDLEDLSDVQAHRLWGEGPASTISSLCLMQQSVIASTHRFRPEKILRRGESRRLGEKEERAKSTPTCSFPPRSDHLDSQGTDLFKSPVLDARSSALPACATQEHRGIEHKSDSILSPDSGLMRKRSNVPSSSAGRKEKNMASCEISAQEREDIGPRLVIGFEPACVFLLATGRKSFVAAACPDRLFLWSDEDKGKREEGREREMNQRKTEMPVVPLRTFVSSPWALQMEASSNVVKTTKGSNRKGQTESGRVVDGAMMELKDWHNGDAPCDVVMLAIWPELEERHAIEDDDQVASPVIIVTGCNHDDLLRWWDLNDAKGGTMEEAVGHPHPATGPQAVCTAITPACVSIKKGVMCDVSHQRRSKEELASLGTLCMTQAAGILLSSHLNGSMVLWHVGQRQRVASFHGLPLFESMLLTTVGLDTVACYEREIIYARRTAAVEQTPWV